MDFDPVPELDHIFGMTCQKNPILHNYITTSYKHMFNDLSDIPPPFRHYIAIMAASRHKCLSSIDFNRKRFIQLGGPSHWLLGVDWSNMRYRKLDYLNKMLAHKPWMIHWKNLAVLIARRDPAGGTSFFSIPSLHHAVGIMAMTHAMCTVFSCVGLERRADLNQDELDFLNMDDPLYWERRRRGLEKPAEVRHTTPVEDVINAVRDSYPWDSPPPRVCEQTIELLDSLIPAPPATYSSRRTSYSPILLIGPIDENGQNMIEREPPCQYPIYSHDRLYEHSEFKHRKERDISAFSTNEFGWDHVYNTMNEYTETLTSRLDRMFNHIEALIEPQNARNKSGQFTARNLQVTRFRQAVFMYTQGLYGVRTDDYNYKAVNCILDRNTRHFIKMAATRPHLITTEYNQFMPGSKDSEKIHTIMLVAMARFQATMFHYTRAVCNYNAMCISRKGWRKPLD